MDSPQCQTHDICPLLDASLKLGPGSFKRFRQGLNGDGSVLYRVNNSRPVHISAVVFEKINDLMDEISGGNLEHPFFIIMNEDERTAVDVIFGAPGDEGYCPHTDALVARALALQAAHSTEGLRLSRGHTHPVFFDELSQDFGPFQKRQTRYFGAIPSNIYGTTIEWNHRKASVLPSRTAIIDEILRRRLYKRFCEDYLESFMFSHRMGFEGVSNSTGSLYHWILTPRTRQIGIFSVPAGKDEAPPGVVVYHPWQVLSDGGVCPAPVGGEDITNS